MENRWINELNMMFGKITGLVCALVFILQTTTANNTGQPNIVIIYVDDMGYGDLGCFGNPTIRTPELDRMAQEGMKLTQFYVAAPVCTPSRAALLTGCYPKRVGLEKHVLFPTSTTGINPSEETLAELLQQQGYATACIGKWHLGHRQPFLPANHGFDIFYGIPYSNDMSQKEQNIRGNNKYKWKLPLISQNETIELDPDQSQFTQTFTKKSIEFIDTNKDRPFFLYLAHPMPHIPLYTSKPFEGRSIRGKYGDVVEELDWSVGEILKTLGKNNIENNTLVIFTSDNGPWKQHKTDGGSPGPLRGGKGTTWEGGVRVPCIVWWPETIDAGRVGTEVVTNMDLLPTIASLCGAPMPEKEIDGRDISGLLLKGEKTIARPFYYYSKNGGLEGVRDGKYKLKLDGADTLLFDLEVDISEEYDLSETMPGRVKSLLAEMWGFDWSLNKALRAAGTHQDGSVK